MDFFKKIDKNFLIFGGGAVVILWQMLWPGYILTLDMVFTPKMRFFLAGGDFYNTLPVNYFLKFLNLFLEGWIVEKIILFSLFFCLGYLAFKFLPVPDKYFSKYWAALFYTVNPFVYERILAGHWRIILAYAFLPPFLHYLIKFGRERRGKDAFLIFLWLLIIGFSSLHFLVMAALVSGIYLIFIFLKNIISDKKKATALLKWSLIGGLIFFVISSYWLIPHLLNKSPSIVSTFDNSHWQAFATASDARLGTTLNVLALYGFWGEGQPWANYFLWPKDNFIFWSIVAVLLFFIIGAGIYSSLKNKESRFLGFGFLILSVSAFIFSCGLGQTIFRGLNLWLFENIDFWAGFRDTQKFSAWLALGYAYFGAIGLAAIMGYLEKIKFKFSKQILIILFLIPIFYTYTMIGGFARQLQPVWYPSDWFRVNDILNRDTSDFKVLFLPWHQYLSLDFNNNLITANPAKKFFDKPVIQGENMEIGGIFSQAGGDENKEIEMLIFDKNKSSEEIIAELKERGVKYIVNYEKLTENDYLKYKFLNSRNLKEVFGGSLKVFEIEAP